MKKVKSNFKRPNYVIEFCICKYIVFSSNIKVLGCWKSNLRTDLLELIEVLICWCINRFSICMKTLFTLHF